MTTEAHTIDDLVQLLLLARDDESRRDETVRTLIALLSDGRFYVSEPALVTTLNDLLIDLSYYGSDTDGTDIDLLVYIDHALDALRTAGATTATPSKRSFRMM